MSGIENVASYFHLFLQESTRSDGKERCESETLKRWVNQRVVFGSVSPKTQRLNFLGTHLFGNRFSPRPAASCDPAQSNRYATRPTTIRAVRREAITCDLSMKYLTKSSVAEASEFFKPPSRHSWLAPPLNARLPSGHETERFMQTRALDIPEIGFTAGREPQSTTSTPSPIYPRTT